MYETQKLQDAQFHYETHGKSLLLCHMEMCCLQLAQVSLSQNDTITGPTSPVSSLVQMPVHTLNTSSTTCPSEVTCLMAQLPLTGFGKKR